MGLQFRKRTKGKDSWINFSHSKKNGFSASLSVKVAKGVTMNFGGKGNRRATVNFGNGLRYVKYRTPKAKTTEPKVRSSNYQSSSHNDSLIVYNIEYYQNQILQLAKQFNLQDEADIQVIVDLHNAIDILRDDPDSLENIDLIVVTTNQFIDLANKTGNQHCKYLANNYSTIIRSYLPKKPITEKPFNKTLLWGTVIGICAIIAMCSA